MGLRWCLPEMSSESQPYRRPKPMYALSSAPPNFPFSNFHLPNQSVAGCPTRRSCVWGRAHWKPIKPIFVGAGLARPSDIQPTKPCHSEDIRRGPVLGLRWCLPEMSEEPQPHRHHKPIYALSSASPNFPFSNFHFLNQSAATARLFAQPRIAVISSARVTLNGCVA